jgi:hypothetical protein
MDLAKRRSVREHFWNNANSPTLNCAAVGFSDLLGSGPITAYAEITICATEPPPLVDAKVTEVWATIHSPRL